MSSEEKPLKAQDWLSGRGRRRVEAVEQAYGTLGLDYGKGHLDTLYLAAYQHGLRDAYAFGVRAAQAWLDDAEGYLDVASQAQHQAAQQAAESGG